MVKPCPHDISEQDIAAQADGLCSLCLFSKVDILKTALRRIRSMDEKNLPKYAREIAGDALDRS